METLRDLLKQENHELFLSFSETFKYAENRIYPSMPFSSGNNESLNSLPHIRDNESYLNGILPISTYLFDKKLSIYISPFEIYAILTANSLHDIGRAGGTGRGHGSKSKAMILKYWRYYNILNEELAKAIGDICEIHEPDNLADEKNIEIEIMMGSSIDIDKVNLKNEALYEVINNPKYYPAQLLDNKAGTLRVNEMGALLSLIDNMDASYRRLAPLDAMDKEYYISPVGFIRSFIKSVNYSLESQAVIVSIDAETVPYENNALAHAEKRKTRKCLIKLKNFFNNGNQSNVSSQISKISEIIERSEYSEMSLSDFLKSTEKDNSIFKKNLPAEKVNNIFKEFIWQIINTVRINNIAEIIKKHSIPRALVLAMILCNIRTCHRSLLNKYKYLSRIGIPVKTWLIQVNEHLYNFFGEETYEPVLTERYLLRIAKSMWDLSTRVFGKSYFTYEMLASSANEKDLNLVKLAVKRIEIISRSEELNLYSIINYNQTVWQWEFSEEKLIKDAVQNRINENRICKFLAYEHLETRIKNLGKPVPKRN